MFGHHWSQIWRQVGFWGVLFTESFDVYFHHSVMSLKTRVSVNNFIKLARKQHIKTLTVWQHNQSNLLFAVDISLLFFVVFMNKRKCSFYSWLHSLPLLRWVCWSTMVRCWYMNQLPGNKCQVLSSLDTHELTRVTGVIYYKVLHFFSLTTWSSLDNGLSFQRSILTTTAMM